MTLIHFLIQHRELVDEFLEELERFMPAGEPGSRLQDHEDYQMFLRGYVMGWVSRVEKLAKETGDWRYE